MIKDSLLIALPSDSSLQHYPENEPNDYTVRLASPISLMGRWEAALLEMSFPYEWINVENAIGVQIISTMTPIQGDLSLLGDLLVAKQRTPPEMSWLYEIDKTTGGLGTDFEYKCVEVPRGDYNTPQELGNALANVVSDWLSAKYRIFQQEKLFQYHYDMKTRTGQYSIAHDRLLVFLVLELEYGILAIALGLPYRQVMSKITTPDEKKICEFLPEYTDYFHPELAGLIPERTKEDYRRMIAAYTDSNRNRVTKYDSIVSFVSPDDRPVYFLTGNAGESMLRSASFVRDGGVDSIYVYSDIVELQMVGDTMAPLLGIVPLKTKKCGSRQFFTFTSPIYLPICKQQFSTIHIRLRTARGKPIPFPENSTNVVCMLHLRRYNPFI